MKKVLVFGKNSFIGGSVRRWLEDKEPKWQVVLMDSRSGELSEADFAGADVVFYVAGIARTWDDRHTKEERKAHYEEINCALTERVARLAKAAGVSQFIFMSSILVYGTARIRKPLLVTSESIPKPDCDYGISKLHAENAILGLESEEFGIGIIRSPLVYGEGEKGSTAMYKKIVRSMHLFPRFPGKRSMILADRLSAFIHWMILEEKRGIFFPQDRNYGNFSQMAEEYSRQKNCLLWQSRLFNPAVRLAARFIPAVDRMFATQVYDKEMSRYPEADRMFEEYRSKAEWFSGEEQPSKKEKCSKEKQTAFKGRKVLLLSSVASMMEQFNRENIKILKKMGCQVDIACNFEKGSTLPEDIVRSFMEEMESQAVRCIQLDFPRGIGSLGKDRTVYKQVSHLLKTEQYDFVHCHSPIGSVIARIACHKLGIPVIYTAHGFQFFKGGPLRDWLVFYPLEKALSGWTDVLITINREDFGLAVSRFFAKKTEYIPGAGFDWERFHNRSCSKEECRELLHISGEAFVVLSVGELCERKNHQALLKALAFADIPDMQCYIAGVGKEKGALERLAARLGIEKQVHFVGYRTDLEKWYWAADIFVMPSKREGMGLAGLEAMAAGLPIVVSGVGGIADYAAHDKTGFVCGPKDCQGMANAIRRLYDEKDLRQEFGRNNPLIAAAFDKDCVNRRMERIYGDMFK